MGLKESGLRGSFRSTSSVLPAFFDVTITNTNSPVQEGDILTVDYSADNTGDAQDTQDIRLEIDSVEEDRDSDITLLGAQSTTGTLEWDTTDEDETTYTATVLSDDDSDSVTVEIGSAIPDSGALHSHFDFSEEDGNLPVSDLSGNGHDLDSGGYSGVNVTINGVQAAEFDGTDDVVTTSDGGDNVSDESPPNTIALVLDCPENSEAGVFEGSPDGNFDHQIGMGFDGPDNEFDMHNDISGGDTDNTPSVLVAVFDGSNSFLRQDGTEVVSGSISSDILKNITLGGQADETTRFWEGFMGEVLIYPDRRTSSQIDEIETYLSDKWDIGL